MVMPLPEGTEPELEAVPEEGARVSVPEDVMALYVPPFRVPKVPEPEITAAPERSESTVVPLTT